MKDQDQLLSQMSETDLWVARTQIMTALRKEVGSSTMKMINELLTIERWLVRKEK